MLWLQRRDPVAARDVPGRHAVVHDPGFEPSERRWSLDDRDDAFSLHHLPPISMSRTTLLIVALASGLMVGCGGTADVNHASGLRAARQRTIRLSGRRPSMSYALRRVNAQPRVSGGTPAQEALARQVLAKLGPLNRIASLAFERPPADYGSAEGSTWITLTTVVEEPSASTAAEWQALLVVGALRDLSVREGLPPIAGRTIGLRLPDGSTGDLNSSVVDPPSAPASDGLPVADLTRDVRGGAAKADIKVVRIDNLPLLSPALSITVLASDPASFIGQRPQKLADLLGGIYAGADAATSDGVYLEVHDQADRLVMISAFSSRLREGLGWVRPDLARFVPR